jgi:hypothetical protein
VPPEACGLASLLTRAAMSESAARSMSVTRRAPAGSILPGAGCVDRCDGDDAEHVVDLPEPARREGACGSMVDDRASRWDRTVREPPPEGPGGALREAPPQMRCFGLEHPV